ncbi:MAG TPA: SbcC/MukB-like Walker B domain-containing protein [Draconibacterium sp.]|nr:SbcC/MukB-like Walker B domain-containing protein [Draconibacterium sp.]
MIPVQLTIQGLYSYQEKQTIDFTRLTSANLFGIFGMVGSGKSSILEAITFAIYGRTDRLNLSGDNRYYNMMNLKSNDLLIDFIFETGKYQTAYRSTVKGKRNSKNFDEVKTLERSAYRKVGNEWIPIENEALETAIGLSYDNFKRTIIIPQGQFHEFLQLGNKDRTQMMKELFNLGKFEFYYKVASLESKNNEQKQLVQGKLQQLGDIDPEKEKAFKAQMVALKSEIDELAGKLKVHRNQEAQWQQIQELAKKLESAKQTLAGLKDKEPGFREMENTILQYEKCVLQFKNRLDALEVSDKKIAQKTDLIKNETQKLNRQEAEIKQNETILLKIQPEYETRELLKQRAEELEKVVKIIELDNKIIKENERLINGEAILNQTIEKTGRLNVERENLISRIKTEKQKLPDLSMLSEVKTWHVEKINFEKQRTEIDIEISKFQNQDKIVKQSVHEIFNSPIFIGFTEKGDIQKAIQHLQQKADEKKQGIKNLENEAGHLRVKVQLEKFAQNMHDGKPCPLCGSLHHPEIYSVKNIREELGQLEKSRLEFEKDIEKLYENISIIKELDSQLKFNAKVLSEWKEKQIQNRIKMEAHLSQFKWPGFEQVSEVNNEFAAASFIQNEIKKKEAELEEISKNLDTAQKDKDRFNIEIEKIKTIVTASKTELLTLQGQLKVALVDQYLDRTTAQIEEERKSLLLKYSQVEKQFNDLTGRLTELRKEKDMLGGSLSANNTELEQEQKLNSELLDLLNEQLKQSEYESIAEVKQVLAKPVELEKQKQALADFKQNLALAASRLEELQTEMGSRLYDADAHQKVKAEILEIDKNITAKNQELGKTEELLKKLQKDMESQILLRKELEKLEVRAENIKTMKSLFKASGFVNYVSSVYLQNLCNAANDRFFQLTRQKLSLEITPDNNFQVRDFMNGGKVRSVKTLSGGQTFQAALSLALSLADNIQKITESNQNFFFLDEGFGSLDKESLAVVFDTLKTLRKESRIVGVISHVEEMQQEIDVHLRIVNDENKGSLIRNSWLE